MRQLVDDYVERTQMMSEQQVCHSFILFGSFRDVSILRAITCSCSARHQRLRSQYAHSRLLYERCHPILASGLVSSERAEEAVSRHIFLRDTTRQRLPNMWMCSVPTDQWDSIKQGLLIRGCLEHLSVLT